MTTKLLLAEQLALLAMKEDSGRHALGKRSQLNACMAGLLLAELVLDGHDRTVNGEKTIALLPGPPSVSPTLAAAGQIVADKGPKIKAVLSHMDRGLKQALGRGTWVNSLGALFDTGCVEPDGGGRGPQRDALVADLRRAAAGDNVLDPRTALLLAMTGPAHLLELVAPERDGRRHARRRIDHVLNGSPVEPIRLAVHKLIAEAAETVASGGYMG